MSGNVLSKTELELTKQVESLKREATYMTHKRRKAVRKIDRAVDIANEGLKLREML